MVESYSPGVKYREPLLLFRSDGKRLRNVTAEAGPFARGLTARGLAVGDFDNDGRLDVLVSNNGGPPLLLRNRAGEPNHWLGLHLVGTRCNRDAIGARITWSVGPESGAFSLVERRPRGRLAAMRSDFGIMSLT